MTIKVKELIEALEKENPEANVFVGHNEDFGILYDLEFSRGDKILTHEEIDEEMRKDIGFDSGQPYSKGAEIYEMAEGEELKQPWVAIIS